MARPVTIENDALKMEVWPKLGGKVSSLIDKADGYELLFNYPAELPSGPQYDCQYVQGWYAGWDECFPAIAGSKYPGHPYDGICVPDHGELWGIPTTAVPTKDGITVVWQGLRFGYRLTRKLWLDGPVVRAQYTLINLAPFDLRFVWSQHALLAMNVPVEIGLDGCGPCRLSHDADQNELQRPFDWPLASEELDLSRPGRLPPRQAWKAFTAEPIRWPARLLYPSRGRSLRVEYVSDDLPAYWGVWVNTGGWGGHRHLSLLPTTGRFDQLDRAVRDGSAGKVEPSGRAEWSTAWSVE